MMNRHRLLVDVVTRYCATRGIALDIRAEGWLLLLGQPPRRQLILGYDFGLNNAVAHRVANDKAATSEILALSDVACVPHSYVMAPISGGAGEPAPEPAWAAMFELLQIHPDGLVVKPNEGTSGRSVTHVRDRGALTVAVNAILTGSTDVALSPFLAIEDEVRVVLLDGTALIVYRKLRPTLTGDGVHSLRELARMATAPKLHTPSLAELDAADLDAVLPQGQQRLLSWRHNLEFGARPELLESGDVRDSCVRLAAAAAQAIGIRFASVDVVRADGRWQVLEINSGVMMETLGKSYPERVDAAYGAALDRLFGDRPNG